MDQAQYDDLLQRLTALVIKLAERYDQLGANYDQLTLCIEEQRTFNREQVAINQRLERLIARVFPLDENGRAHP